MPSKIRVGIVGTGGMAAYHAESLLKIPGVVLASCHDILPEKSKAFAERFKIPHVAKDQKSLHEHVDAVSVVTPDRFHAAASLAALSAGKHLLCEKPLTVTLAEARKVAAAALKAKSKNVISLVNFSYRRSAAMQKAMELVASGQLGEIRHVHSFYLQTWLSTPVWGAWNEPGWLWRLRTAAGSGGVLGDVGCHILDLTTAVAGDLDSVNCSTSTFPKLLKGKAHTHWKGEVLDANDTAIMQLQFKKGGVGVLHTTRWATGRVNQLRLEVHGTNGALMFDLDRSYEQLDVCLGKDVQKSAWKTMKFKPSPNIWERFIAAIRSGKADQPDVARGAQIQAYLHACQRSAETHRWEKIPSVS
ncbi:MAG: Gfo/Idh/MocA family oxidoreductase [candidate division FCPU426 bacterium]